MIADMNLIVEFLFDCFDSVIAAYMVNGVLTMVFAVWLVKKISRLLDHIR